MIQRNRYIPLAMLSLSLWTGSARALDHADEDPVQQACEGAGVDTATCACISREANSRFSHEQLSVLGTAMPDLGRISQDPALAGPEPLHERFTAEELAHLEQRARAADIVIRQACGVGLSLGETG